MATVGGYVASNREQQLAIFNLGTEELPPKFFFNNSCVLSFAVQWDQPYGLLEKQLQESESRADDSVGSVTLQRDELRTYTQSVIWFPGMTIHF